MDDEICIVEGCTHNKRNSNYYCGKHQHQLKRHGKILDRTIYDRNEIDINNDYAEIIIRDTNCVEVARTKIDLGDIKKVEGIKIHLSADGYAIMKIKNKNVKLHRFLMNVSEEQIIDHINRNPLDNRKINLRITTQTINCFNSTFSKRNKTGVKGVHWDKFNNKWMVNMKRNGKTINLGRFNNFQEAVDKRKIVEIEYYNETYKVI